MMHPSWRTLPPCANPSTEVFAVPGEKPERESNPSARCVACAPHARTRARNPRRFRARWRWRRTHARERRSGSDRRQLLGHAGGLWVSRHGGGLNVDLFQVILGRLDACGELFRGEGGRSVGCGLGCRRRCIALVLLALLAVGSALFVVLAALRLALAGCRLERLVDCLQTSALVTVYGCCFRLSSRSRSSLPCFVA